MNDTGLLGIGHELSAKWEPKQMTNNAGRAGQDELLTLPTGDRNSVTIENINALAVFEARVMHAVWALNREVAIAEILEWMQNDIAAHTPAGERPRRIAYTSVLTTVNNLVEKGFLNQDRSPVAPTYKNAFMYTAKMTRGQYKTRIAHSLTAMAAKVSFQTAADTLQGWRAVGDNQA